MPDGRREVSGVAGGRRASRCAPLAGAAGDCRVFFDAGREVSGVLPVVAPCFLLSSGVWTAAAAYVRTGEARGVFVAALEVAGRTVCVVALTHCRSANPHAAEGKRG